MTLETIYFISQVIAAVAIVASLLFVGIQLRMGRKQAEDAERVVRGQVLQHIAAEHRQHSIDMLAYPEVYSYFVGGANQIEMTDHLRAQFSTFCYATLHMAQNIFFQHRKGLLDDTTFEAYMPMIIGFMSSPAAQTYWESRRNIFFDADFVKMMDKRFASADSLGLAVGGGAAELPGAMAESTDEGPDA